MLLALSNFFFKLAQSIIIIIIIIIINLKFNLGLFLAGVSWQNFFCVIGREFNWLSRC